MSGSGARIFDDFMDRMGLDRRPDPEREYSVRVSVTARVFVLARSRDEAEEGVDADEVRAALGRAGEGLDFE